MQSVRSRIWTRVAVSKSFDDNHYTTGTSLWGVRWLWYCSREMMLVIDFFSYPPHSPVIFFLLVKAAQELRTERKETGILFSSILFSGFTTILWWECFPEPIEITMLFGQGIEEIPGIILAIVNLKIRHVCSVDMFSWRCNELETRRVARPEGLANTYAPIGRWEKRKPPPIQVCQMALWRQEAPLFRDA